MSPSMHSLDDASLWLMMKGGKEAAFEALYKKYIGDLLAYGDKMGLDSEVLKDLIQDLFVEIWRSKERLSDTDSIKFYLFKALRYKIIRHHQRALSAIPIPGDWAEQEESVEARMLNAEQNGMTAKQLQLAIAKLPKRQQEIIHLRFFQGFSNREIASLMNLQYQSASNLIQRSLQSIRQYLQVPMPLL